MDQWDQDFVDLEVPGHVTVRKDGTGSFQFGMVQGELDCRIDDIGGIHLLAFTWDGSDECDQVSGRGWVRMTGRQLEGHIYIHLGDDSGFTAKKMK